MASSELKKTLNRTEHRPYLLPKGAWVLRMRWLDLLFMHWPVPEASLRLLVPPALKLDTFDGSAWLGITPFRMERTHPRFLPAVPWLSSFLELNVRTYVTIEGKPGIWFFSLDASTELAVQAARRTYRLPYFRARIVFGRREGWIEYECARAEEAGRVWNGRYRSTGPVFHAEPGSLEWFLTERYCLYTTDERGVLQRAEIHHAPWPLQPAECEIELNTISRVDLPDEAPLCHFARRQDVV